MAKPNVWRADIHLTDRIIVSLTFYRLITGTQDTLSLSLPVALSFSVSQHSGWIRELTRGQDARTDNIAFCSACRSPHLASSPLLPRNVTCQTLLAYGFLRQTQSATYSPCHSFELLFTFMFPRLLSFSGI